MFPDGHLEPAISAAIAVALSLLLGSAFSLGNLLAGGLMPFLAALLGGWLGERRQRSHGVMTTRAWCATQEALQRWVGAWNRPHAPSATLDG